MRLICRMMQKLHYFRKYFFVSKHHFFDTREYLTIYYGRKIMNTEKQDLLISLIDNQIFEASGSALASKLGYKGRMFFSRLRDGKIKESTVVNYLERICEVFNLNPEDLDDINRMVCAGKYLYRNLTEYEIAGKPNIETADRILVALVRRNYDTLSESFRKNIAPYIDDLYNNDQMIFFGMSMIAYIKLLGINPYSSGRNGFISMMHHLIEHIYSVLQKEMPENAVAQRTMVAYLSDDVIRKTPQCYWGMLYYTIHILGFYSDPEYINTILELGKIFDEWGETSYWHEYGRKYGKGEKLFSMYTHSMRLNFRGMYLCQEFTAGKDTETFIEGNNVSIIFDDTDEYSGRVQVESISCQDKFFIYNGRYEINDTYDEITFHWDDEEREMFRLPEKLKMVSFSKPEEKDEQVWTNIVRKFDENGSQDIFTDKLMEKLETEYMDDSYDIQDIIISRQWFSMIIKTEDGIKEYRIPTEAYSFLKLIRISDDVIIKKNTTTGNLLVSWPCIGYEIPMSEFEVCSAAVQ